MTLFTAKIANSAKRKPTGSGVRTLEYHPTTALKDED